VVAAYSKWDEEWPVDYYLVALQEIVLKALGESSDLEALRR